MQQRPFSLTHMPRSALSQIAIYVMNKINELWFRIHRQYSSNLKCIEHWSIVNPVHPGSQVLELLCSQHGGGREGMLKTNATIISHEKKKKMKKKILPLCSNPAISILIPMLSVLLITLLCTPLPHEMKFMWCFMQCELFMLFETCVKSVSKRKKTRLAVGP